jgi:DNA-binding protein H-NS
MPRGRQGLASMSIDALISLRDDVGRVLKERGEELRRRLQQVESDAWGSSARKAAPGRRGGKIPPKYRDPDNPANVWAGRGAIPRWMAEKIKSGAKREDFLIGTGEAAPGRRKRTAKKTTKRAKTASSRAPARARSRTKAKSKAVRTAKKRQRQQVRAVPPAAASTTSKENASE